MPRDAYRELRHPLKGRIQNMNNNVVEVKNLKKIYATSNTEASALCGVSLSFAAGQFTSIMGPGGSGKSTLLHLIGGLARPSSGRVKIGGQALEDFSDDALSVFRRRRLGFIFRFFNLVPTLTALENVALPLLIDGTPISKVKPKAMELLDLMGLSRHMYHRPDQLSAGQMQRVAIARAFVTDPLLVLADEPTGNLDSETGSAVLAALARLVRTLGQTVVMASHDLKAAAYSDRVVRFRGGLIESDKPIAAQVTASVWASCGYS